MLEIDHVNQFFIKWREHLFRRRSSGRWKLYIVSNLCCACACCASQHTIFDSLEKPWTTDAYRRFSGVSKAIFSSDRVEDLLPPTLYHFEGLLERGVRFVILPYDVEPVTELLCTFTRSHRHCFSCCRNTPRECEDPLKLVLPSIPTLERSFLYCHGEERLLDLGLHTMNVHSLTLLSHLNRLLHNWQERLGEPKPHTQGNYMLCFFANPNPRLSYSPSLKDSRWSVYYFRKFTGTLMPYTTANTYEELLPEEPDLLLANGICFSIEQCDMDFEECLRVNRKCFVNAPPIPRATLLSSKTNERHYATCSEDVCDRR